MKLTPYQHGQKAFKNGLIRSYGADYDFCYEHDMTGIITQETINISQEWKSGYDDAYYDYSQAKRDGKF